MRHSVALYVCTLPVLGSTKYFSDISLLCVGYVYLLFRAGNVRLIFTKFVPEIMQLEAM